MAFRRDRLEAVGGFDTQFHRAGDDVDLCWRLQERGWTLGFNAAAVVFHHRRDSVRRYLRQQFGYGAAEAMLERKWPEKYNGAGHLSWRGRVYSGSAQGKHARSRRARIEYGTWGLGPFQRLYAPAPRVLDALSASPEWYLVVAGLAAVSFLGAFWHPLLVAAPMLVLAIAALLANATRAATTAAFPAVRRSPLLRLRLRALTALLHVVGPAARLAGRIAGGLTPWRYRHAEAAIPWPRTLMTWTDRWAVGSDRLGAVEAAIRAQGAAVRRSGTFDRWDLEIRQGSLGIVRLLMAVEENPGRTQIVRVRWWPRLPPFAVTAAVLLAGLAAAAALDGSAVAAIVLAVGFLALVGHTARQCATAAGVTMQALRQHAFVETALSTASYHTV
jgi:O-antigen biosynthesis protein